MSTINTYYVTPSAGKMEAEIADAIEDVFVKAHLKCLDNGGTVTIATKQLALSVGKLPSSLQVYLQKKLVNVEEVTTDERYANIRSKLEAVFKLEMISSWNDKIIVEDQFKKLSRK